MRPIARFILVQNWGHEILINISRIESIRATADPNVCQIHMIGDKEDECFDVKHTLQDLVFVLDEAADVHIAGVRVKPEGLTSPEIESMTHKKN